jgi:predicted RNA binding protein YcfA (HicA-like mRNA interferase family)
VSKTDKLLKKLQNETISASELRTLLVKLGWLLDGGKGSHEVWKKGLQRIVLATHGKEIPRYQIKSVKQAVGV